PPEVALATAGGLDRPGQPLGTDAALILRAIEQVYSDEGVVVLMDLGSAVMSAEMAVELLPADRRSHVFLSEAPLVEGALAAAVQARLGNPLARVLAEARGALAGKGIASQTNTPTDNGLDQGPGTQPAPAPPTELQLQLTIKNRLGLHLRPAARFVQTASRFGQAAMRVWNLA